MSELHREQRPLLCDDLSDEELSPQHCNPRYQWRFRSMGYKGRASNNVKGAAAIITRWPEHWTSSLTYWWIGLGMIAVTIFIIYNSIVAFAMLPSAYLNATRTQALNKKNEFISHDSSSHESPLPEVFMHLLVDSNEEVDLNKCLPYMEIIANKYLYLKYNLIIVLNDTSRDNNKPYTSEQNNEIALNSLWTEHNSLEQRKMNRNINVKYVTLSQYMNDSPLRKQWKHLPHQFIEFLIRIISIWNKGGVAFNPEILTPQSPHAIYIEKLQHILNKYNNSVSDEPSNELKSKNNCSKQQGKLKKRVNNIRDIIELLENEVAPYNPPQPKLTEAENEDIDVPIVSHHTRKLLFTNIPKNESGKKSFNIMSTHLKNDSYYDNKTENLNYKYYLVDNKTHEPLKKINSNVTTISNSNDSTFFLKNNNSTKISLLPMFLEFLFHDKSKSNYSNVNFERTDLDNVTRRRKSIIPIDDGLKKNISLATVDFLSEIKRKENEKEPLIIAANVMMNNNLDKESNEVPKKCENVKQLTIDLKGNIVATDIACHAFIGTVFNNVIHHTEEESLTDFIISELSMFCNGLLSSCKGIDVILL